MRKKWFAAGIFAIAIATALTGCSPEPQQTSQAPEEKETPVQIANIEKGTISQQNEMIGTAEPSKSVDVIPKLNGELVKLNVKKGDFVKKGAPLGKIDAEDLEIQLQLEQFGLEQAQDQYKSVYAQTQSGPELDQAERGVEQAKLRVKQAQNRLNDAQLTAPISGRVIRVTAEEGGFVTASGPLFTIVSTNPVTLTANVSTNQMLMLQDRAEAQVTVPDLGQTLTARITYLAPVANDSGFYRLEAELDNAEEKIKPGMIAKFIVEQELMKDALIVPTESIVEKGGESYIFIVKDGRAVEKTVEVLESQTETSAVKGEFNENDQVVVKGQITLADGNKVKIIEGAR
ncbi:efflux RND transporter periplasmic adaptor subunit [Paenibacillus sp. MSJ-34]|uniref:efflux RND transporter periplasmic adaptor subunit n=1 Tax=Paenibacillus sp. MSJ-34 TaxID=2841529 RepID=UPI001C112448|nr:efflux RND transporter periplasmic adaptor subunit [Paenibacillus sp. MSJ-34]